MNFISNLPLLTVLFYCLAPTLVVSAQLLPPPPSAPNPTPPPGRLNPPPLTIDPGSNPLSSPDRVYSSSPNSGLSPRPATIPLSPTPLPSANTTLRVLALVNDPVQEQQIRSLFPESFGIRHQGQRALQVGRFSDQANAQSIAQNLQTLGVKTLLIP